MTAKTKKAPTMALPRIVAAWKCPQCGAGHNAHGRGECKSPSFDRASACDGLVCECWEDGVGEEISGAEDHGLSFSNPCIHASCYHCGWGGCMPVKPKGLQPWEKKALEAGWSPPSKRKKELGI